MTYERGGKWTNRSLNQLQQTASKSLFVEVEAVSLKASLSAAINSLPMNPKVREGPTQGLVLMSFYLRHWVRANQ
jgi:hypothetical protein